MKTKNVYFFFCVFFLFIFISCTLSSNYERTKKVNLFLNSSDVKSNNLMKTGSGNVFIKLNGIKNENILEYYLTAINEKNQKIELNSINQSIALTLPVGNWDIYVEAADMYENIIYEGSKNILITFEQTEIDILLFKRLGNLKLKIDNLPGYNIKKGEPGYITKIKIEAFKEGLPAIIREVNSFENTILIKKIISANYLFKITCYGDKISSEDYSVIEDEYTPYLYGEYKINIPPYNTVYKSVILSDQLKVTPVKFSHNSGNYIVLTNLVLTCDTKGATIIWTENDWQDFYEYPDGDYPITIESTKTIKARAYKSGMQDSMEAERTYLFKKQGVYNPVFSPPGGMYNEDIEVAISNNNEGSIIFYSLTEEGQVPMNNPILNYTEPIKIYGNKKIVTLRAIVYVGSTPSDIITHKYIINYPQTSTPKIYPDEGIYNKNQLFTIECTTPGSDIYYTFDGSSPDDINNDRRYIYDAPFRLNVGEHIVKFYAVNDEYSDSEIVTKSIKIMKESNNLIIIEEIDIIIVGNDWNEMIVNEGITWFGFDIEDEGEYVIEHAHDYDGLFEAYNYFNLQKLGMKNNGNNNWLVLLGTGKYLVKVKSELSIDPFLIRIYKF